WGWWLLVGTLVTVCVGTAIAWRKTMKDFVLPEAIGATAAIRPTTPTTAAPTTPVELPIAVEPKKPEAGWLVTYEGHVPIEGGVLHLPKTFEPTGGGYDLIVHFHGDVAIVKESVEHAGLNAALAIINVGIRSGPYRKAYQAAGAYESLLEQVRIGLKRKGVREPELRRLALTSWSAGYGAIESILEHRVSPDADADPLDAIISLDGVHAGFQDGDAERINERSLMAYIQAAKAATEGQLMVSLTHSDIDPGAYAGTRRSQLYLLEQLGIHVTKQPMLPLPEHLSLVAARGAVASGKEKKMVPTSDTRVGMLRVQGFEGNTREDHAAHLTQMAAVALPDLRARWSKPREQAPALDD
ncbi:MAG: hypothetical protein RIF41_32775, partial [Polyangiaceae bacterium]